MKNTMKNANFLILLGICCLPTVLSAQNITIENLSQARGRLSATAVGGKVLFAGGLSALGPSSLVDIRDTATGVWTTKELSIARRQLAAAQIDEKAYFLGGNNESQVLDAIDVFDANTNQWSTRSLPHAVTWPQVRTWGSHIIVAGGLTNRNPIIATDSMLIWNTATDTWSGYKLPEPSIHVGLCVVNNKLIVTGGTNINDATGVREINDYFLIIDLLTGTREERTMSVAKSNQMGIAFNNKAYIIGGATDIEPATEEILVYDEPSGNLSSIFSPNIHATAPAFAIGKKLFLAGSQGIDPLAFQFIDSHAIVDVLDTETMEWESFLLSQELGLGGSVSYGNKFYIGGGFDPFNPTSVVNIYEDATSFTNAIEDASYRVNVYPNAFSDTGFDVSIDNALQIEEMYFTDTKGNKYPAQKGWNASNGMTAGAYFLVVKTNKGTATRKCVKL
jgi:hypothetical protein